MSRGGLGLRSYPQPDLDNTSVGNGVCPYKERTVKRIIISALVLVSAVAAFAQPAREENVLTVYSYDSFSGEWGPAGTLIPAFEEKTGIKVNLVGAGDAVQMLSRLELEGENTPADVVLGITDDFAYRAYGMLSPYDSPVLSEIPDELEFDSEHRLIPFDYGAFAFVYDSESGVRKPESLEDLSSPEYKDKIILIDPRTSSVGLGLLYWTYNQFGDKAIEWWKAVGENALTIADGWSSAYGLFTEGEAPIVLSYTTSPVYHVMNDDTTRYQAIIFPEGHEATIEGIGILRNTDMREEAEAFVDFILTDAQLDIAIANSMYPANGAIELPEAFAWAPKPAIMYTSSAIPEEKRTELVDSWTEAMTH